MDWFNGQSGLNDVKVNIYSILKFIPPYLVVFNFNKLINIWSWKINLNRYWKKTLAIGYACASYGKVLFGIWVDVFQNQSLMKVLKKGFNYGGMNSFM